MIKLLILSIISMFIFLIKAQDHKEYDKNSPLALVTYKSDFVGKGKDEQCESSVNYLNKKEKITTGNRGTELVPCKQKVTCNDSYKFATLGILAFKGQSKIKEHYANKVISSISDSAYIGSKYYHYSFPYIELANKKHAKPFNDTIARDIRDVLDWPEDYNVENYLKNNLSKYVDSIELNKQFLEYYDFKGSSFEITFDKGDILCLKLWISADKYDTSFEYNFDLKTGSILITSDLFKTNSDPLVSIINREIEASVKLLKKEPEETNCIEILIENSNFILKDLPNSFTIENKGVKFNYSFDYDYNYCRFLECAGPKLFFTFEELRPYLKDEFKKRIGLSN